MLRSALVLRRIASVLVLGWVLLNTGPVQAQEMASHYSQTDVLAAPPASFREGLLGLATPEQLVAFRHSPVTVPLHPAPFGSFAHASQLRTWICPPVRQQRHADFGRATW